MEDGVRSFEDLEAWQLARELVRAIYAIFRREPGSRDFGLRDQIERAAVSVMTNIAEGFERAHLSENFSSTISPVPLAAKSAPSPISLPISVTPALPKSSNSAVC